MTSPGMGLPVDQLLKPAECRTAEQRLVGMLMDPHQLLELGIIDFRIGRGRVFIEGIPFCRGSPGALRHLPLVALFFMVSFRLESR